jgi:hypothetical protein
MDESADLISAKTGKDSSLEDLDTEDLYCKFKVIKLLNHH